MKIRSLFLLFFLSLSVSTYAQDNKIDFVNDSLRILYVGYDNVVVVPKGSTLETEGNSTAVLISKMNELTYIIKVNASFVGKPVKLKSVIRKKVTVREFKTATLPAPSPFVGGINTETTREVKKSDFLPQARNGIRISYPADVILRINFPVEKFHVLIKVAGIALLEEDVTGGKFSEKMMKIFKNQKKFTLECTNIYAKTKDGAQMRSKGFTLEVSE